MNEAIVSVLKEFSVSIKLLTESRHKTKDEKPPKEKWLEAIKNILLFFSLVCVIFFIALAVFFNPAKYYNLYIVFSIILGGNLFIAVMIQTLHYFLLKRDISIDQKNDEKEEKDKNDFLYKDFWDCSIRCSAGILEMILYTICFAVNMVELVVGYLVLKTIGIWKSEKNQREAGLFTAVYRMAVIVSLFFSLWASYFLLRYLRLSSFPAIFDLGEHFLFE